MTGATDRPEANESGTPGIVRVDRPVRRPKVCVHCGEIYEKHCEFEAAMPDGCVCPTGEWGAYVFDVCAAFVGEGATCDRCEHDRECHAA